MSAAISVAAELHEIAQAVGRLRPDWRDAEQFYEQRSEIIGALRRLARNGHALAPAPLSRPAPPPRVIVREQVRVVLLSRHLVRPPRRHRYPRPPLRCERQLLLKFPPPA